MLAGNRSAVAELTDTITGTIEQIEFGEAVSRLADACLLYTSPSPRDHG